MSDTMHANETQRSYWISGNLKPIATSLTGLIAVLVALKAMTYGTAHEPTLTDHLSRLIIFASLTIWMTLSIGMRKRGSAAVIVLAFASFLELFVIPSRGDQMGTLASANLGIVFAYAGLQFYWFRISGPVRNETGADAVTDTSTS